MTNQSPESVIAEVIEYHADTIGSHYDGCYKHHAVCLAVKLRDMLRDMLREPGVPDAATAAIERARVEVESINQAAQKSLCGSEPDHAGIYEGAARALAALDGAPEPEHNDSLNRASAWSDYRSEYGVHGTQSHRDFCAGWDAARGTLDIGGVQR